jgi:hypothetical protein
MVNVCIAVRIEENVSSLKSLSLKSYHRLNRDILGYYRRCAISRATGIIRNYRKAKKKNSWMKFPYAKKLMLTTCYGFKITDGLLRLPVKPRTYVYVKLNSHTVQVLSGVKVRSVTPSLNSLSISYSRERTEVNPEGYVGIDCNLDNVTAASTDRTVRTFDLSKATMIKADYRYVKSQFKRNDARIRTRVYNKYGDKQQNRVQPLLHRVSKRIVEEAKSKRQGIVLERLTGIRRLLSEWQWAEQELSG